MNAFGSEDKISIWALENTKLNSVREIERITVIGEIVKKRETKSIALTVFRGGRGERVFRHQ